MTFEEIPLKMMQLGVDRAWLALQCDYSISSIANILAAGGNPKSKTDKALRRIWEVLDREDERRKKPNPPEEKCAMVIRTTADEFANWNVASMNEHLTVENWAVQQLNRAAKMGMPLKTSPPIKQSLTTDQFPDAGKSIEIPLLRAAAGSPILADAEMIEVEKDYGVGRFMLELRGDSMEPLFRNKQRIIMREKSTLNRPVLKYGLLYCFVHEGCATFKQWAKDSEGNKILHSFNPEHPDIPADADTDWVGWYDPADNA